jgi:hypothetical protein
VILSTAIPALQNETFVSDDEAQHFNVLYQFNRQSNEDIDAFIEILNEEVAKIEYFDLSTSKDVYDENTTFVVVHGLKSIHGAEGFAELLRTGKTDKRGQPAKSRITREFIPISSPNYAIIQRHKNLNAYLKLK